MISDLIFRGRVIRISIRKKWKNEAESTLCSKQTSTKNHVQFSVSRIICFFFSPILKIFVYFSSWSLFAFDKYIHQSQIFGSVSISVSHIFHIYTRTHCSLPNFWLRFIVYEDSMLPVSLLPWGRGIRNFIHHFVENYLFGVYMCVCVTS